MANLQPKKRVKLNYCSASELMTLPGVGKKRAEMIIQHRSHFGPFLSYEDLEVIPGINSDLISSWADRVDWSFGGYFLDAPLIIQADANRIALCLDHKVDLIVTSPPYWLKRDYQHPQQLGQEPSADEYVNHLSDIVNSWIPLLLPHSTVFLNIGDTYQNHSLAGVPARLEVKLINDGWLVVNKIIWAKSNGVPEPLQYRLASRHEVILQLARTTDYYADAHALSVYLENSGNPGDVWSIPHSRSKSEHLAPFPEELIRWILHFACPNHVCKTCGRPFRRQIEPTFELDMTRPQARRAIELFHAAGLTEEHLRAIRAVGISDAGKALRTQLGAESNAEKTKQLAKEAKQVLSGYFREFTFSRKAHVGWNRCECDLNTRPGIVLDPFMGSGTTMRVAHQMGYIAIGSDLVLSERETI